MTVLKIDDIIPCGTQVTCPDTLTEWDFGVARESGGMGVVYEVFERHAPFRRGALKMLRPDRLGDRNRFELEIMRHKKGIGGDGVVKFYGSGEINGQRFFIMQWGEPVGRDLGIGETLALADDLLQDLTGFRENHVCHGDVKPANVLVVDGCPKLIDLGSVRPLVPDGKEEKITFTPGYSAAELTGNDFATTWVDVFGLCNSLKEIASPEARAVFADAIFAGTDTRTEKRLNSLEELKKLFHAGHAKCRKRRRRRLVARTVTHVLVAALTLAATTYFYRHANMRRLEERELQAHAEYIAGKACRELGDPANAVYFYERALKDGHPSK